MQTLTFQNIEFNVVDRNGQTWLRSPQIAEALGYADASSINRIFARNADEFTNLMTGSVKLTDPYGDMQETRIFSLRGAHLLGMLSRTKQAKEFRRWVLDVLEQQKPAAPQLPEVQEELLNLRFERRRFWVLRLPSGYWFVSAEVANALALSSRDIIQNHVPAAYRTKYKIGRQDCNIVSLEGLERAYLLADQTKAQALREFVQGVVALPHIEPVATPAQPAALPAPKRPLDIHFPLDYLAEQNVGRLTVRDGQRSWLDLTLQELREPFQSPCEIILYQLANAGFEVEAAWWELRTYRNKLESLLSAINSLNITVQEPARYATGDEG